MLTRFFAWPHFSFYFFYVHCYSLFIHKQQQHCQRFDNWYLWPRDNQCYKQWRQGRTHLIKYQEEEIQLST
jgi:hypothetical protein